MSSMSLHRDIFMLYAREHDIVATNRFQ